MTKAVRYDNESISALKGADRVRLRPSVIFGSDDLNGCQHSFFEILSNSIDEARAGFGHKITVTRFQDGSLSVEDEGRGVPVDFNENEQRYNWELVYCELYAGGKYDQNGINYEFSLGLNGLGACATQYASRYFEVEVVRDGYLYQLNFERGENIGGLIKTETNRRKTGTIQRWLPDDDVFTEIFIPKSYFEDVLQKQAIVNPGVKFIFIDKTDQTTTEFVYPEGILGYINEINSETPLTEGYLFSGEGSGKDRKDKEEYKVHAEIAFAFNNETNLLSYYHNSSWLEHGGSPDRAVRNAFVAEFDREIKERDKYKNGETKIVFSDIEDSLILMINSFSSFTSYANQTKKAINNRFIQQFLTRLIREKLQIWFIEKHDIAEKVIDQILINKRSRENAEKQRLNIRKKLMGTVDNMSNRVRNFVDCKSKDVNKRELYIVEGNSALGSVKMARDSEYQGVIPVRGKILNCLKASYNQIFNSDIIVDLLKILGCGVEIHSKHNRILSDFDLKKLRWDKIIICTDADVDGFQIRTLILTMLYRLTPTLINEGKVYIAESPLFEITHTLKGLEKTYFAYTEQEKNEILENLKNGRVHLQRSKGLGENEPEMMWQTTMNPETRRLIQVMPEDKERMFNTFNLLLGDNLAGRKQYIADHGHEYMDMLDVV
ncbi:MAG: DNA topoisomerase [Clostridiaceae bacterium]|jgi:DNA gyrase subunit B|nr:toprim domain-containing protein [Bacillota bacterium]NLN51271.1 DNA topoisomerase [Clostridiaceae bacterium]